MLDVSITVPRSSPCFSVPSQPSSYVRHSMARISRSFDFIYSQQGKSGRKLDIKLLRNFKVFLFLYFVVPQIILQIFKQWQNVL